MAIIRWMKLWMGYRAKEADTLASEGICVSDYLGETFRTTNYGLTSWEPQRGCRWESASRETATLCCALRSKEAVGGEVEAQKRRLRGIVSTRYWGSCGRYQPRQLSAEAELHQVGWDAPELGATSTGACWWNKWSDSRPSKYACWRTKRCWSSGSQ